MEIVLEGLKGVGVGQGWGRSVGRPSLCRAKNVRWELEVMQHASIRASACMRTRSGAYEAVLGQRLKGELCW